MKKILLILLLINSVLASGQFSAARKLLMATAYPPTYVGKYLNQDYPTCNYLLYGRTLNNSVIFDLYEGMPFDSIQFFFLNDDVDGDGYGGFNLRLDQNTPVTLPYTISINGLSESTNYIYIYHTNPSGILCTNPLQQASVWFRIKDTNGTWGEYRNFAYNLYYSGTTATKPIVVTGEVNDVYNFGAMVSGEVTDDGGATVTERGFVWNTTGSPTTADNKVTSGSGVGSFEEDIFTGTCGVTYYVRAYAINSEGTSYGEEVEFTTTSVNLMRFSLTTRVYALDCPEYDTGIIQTEQDAKDGADLYFFLLNSSSCELRGNGYASRVNTQSVGEQIYSFVDCQIINSGYRDRWFLHIDRITDTYYIVYIDTNGILSVFYEYIPQ